MAVQQGYQTLAAQMTAQNEKDAQDRAEAEALDQQSLGEQDKGAPPGLSPSDQEALSPGLSPSDRGGAHARSRAFRRGAAFTCRGASIAATSTRVTPPVAPTPAQKAATDRAIAQDIVTQATKGIVSKEDAIAKGKRGQSSTGEGGDSSSSS